MPSGPVVVLWTIPRSASTAFERMTIERGDHTVIHEPFSLHYYFGPHKRSLRYDEVRPDATPETIAQQILTAARSGPVFVKDMAYHVVGQDIAALLPGATHSFLVRDPARSLPSLARHWPDFTPEEAGFETLADLADTLTPAGETPTVIDADDLLVDPVGTVRAWCDAVGIPFLPDALTWEPGMRAEWDVWEDWHADVADSTGLHAVDALTPPAPVDPALADVHARCAPVYEHLHNLRIRPGVDP